MGGIETVSSDMEAWGVLELFQVIWKRGGYWDCFK